MTENEATVLLRAALREIAPEVDLTPFYNPAIKNV